MKPKMSLTIVNMIVSVMFYCRSFENNLRTYKLLAHRKPESELPVVSQPLTFPENSDRAVSSVCSPLTHTTSRSIVPHTYSSIQYHA